MTNRRALVPGSARAAARAEARAQARSRLASPIGYADELPITARKDDIVTALAAHQVIVVAGETGSGKSTQLPKMCLEAGRGSAGMIGHTQPRRIAARSIGERVAEELSTPLGGAVGYKVRFTDRVGDGTLIKLMTDGVLLAELHGDPELRAYDTLIIDEAHERSLNIDFILGYLKRLLPDRPDLHVVITSATIDTGRFSQHFDNAPIIEVSGRTYPVDIRYRPLDVVDGDDEDNDGEPGSEAGMDEVQAVCDAVTDLCREGAGDILVFLAGEREIRDTADALAKSPVQDVDVLPLYGRLSSAEQHRIFEPHPGRRVVLATNVAETSLTVPGIRYVVDPGTARISRYSRRTKVQRLPIEPISQASANQRTGRCGRLGPGICIRLYSPEDFAARRPFTEPEILRTNLASVVLQMAAIGLGNVEDFPFVDPPDRRNVKDGVALLEELGALAVSPQDDGGGMSGQSQGPRLTAIGRQLARLPLDPRLGRMVLEAGRSGCLDEVLVITSGLSVQDPRERPAEKREAASALHSRFDDESSDFISYLNLWGHLFQRQSELSSGQFRRLCRKELISYQRAREWQDVHGQLAELCRQLGLARGPLSPGPLDERRRARLHQALLAGLATQVGAREGDRTDFAAPRGARFAIWPGSVLAKKAPRWVMAAELVETGRLWARVAAPVRPQWVEAAAAHLLRWTYSEPAWDPARGEAFVTARATLYGLVVVAGRRLDLVRYDAPGARDIFIRQALVELDWDGAPDFAARNLDLLQHLRGLLQRARRSDLMVGDDVLFDFYGARLPAEVTSGRAFAAWWRRQQPAVRARLEATPDDLQAHTTVDIDASAFPDEWVASGDTSLALRYNWDPGEEDDGVVVEVPLAQLGRLAAEGLEWQVPGLREELVTALLRSLPKDLRRHLVPVPEHARDFVAKAGPADGPLLPALARAMSEAAGVHIVSRDFDWGKVPSYLRPTFCVVDETGQPLARGKETDSLYAELRPQLDRALQDAARSSSLSWGAPGRRSTTWDFGEVPEVFEPEWHGYRLRGFPALVDEGDAVSVRVFADRPSALLAMAAGTRRLLLLGLSSRRQLVNQLEGAFDNRTRLALGGLRGLAYQSPREVAEDAVSAAIDQAVAAHGGPAWDAVGFDGLVSAVRSDVEPQARKAVPIAARITSRLHELWSRAEQLAARSVPALSLDDVLSELAWLSGPRFVSRAGLARLPDIERYLTAVERRLEKLPTDPRRDVGFTQRVHAVEARLDEAVALAQQERRSAGAIAQLEDLRWMIEELRVSFFAQSLGTKVPVSEERILKAINQLSAQPPASAGGD